MIRWLLPALLAGAMAPAALADQPAGAASSDACLVLNNRVIGPRVPDRPLPLLSGDPTHGFHAACTVPWSKLSPTNHPLPVTNCYQGSLLQVENDAACGRQTGPLWISSRWVVTSAELEDSHAHAVVCQQLETGAWAGTRDLKLDCVPQKKELSLEPTQAAPPAKTSTASPATPAESAAPTVPGNTTAPPATPPRPDR
jgi:hypothetical protein